jgi:flagellar secretion chaperone FliS
MTMDPALTYRQSQGQNASPVRLVVLLYEQLIKDLQRALQALEQSHVEERCRAIDHALMVAAELQARLDMEHGGEVARNLERFYEVFRASLLEAQIKRSKAIFQDQIANLLSLREAWLEVEHTTEPVVSPPAPFSPNGEPPSSTSPSGDWTV